MTKHTKYTLSFIHLILYTYNINYKLIYFKYKLYCYKKIIKIINLFI